MTEGDHRFVPTPVAHAKTMGTMLTARGMRTLNGGTITATNVSGPDVAITYVTYSERAHLTPSH
ncbi:hypothetical protein [Nocardioides sp. CER19]|uniref:hypothetical protein n=1 Tax=Nocardioides sp. CER19 TaxID=3038538 RepID=UPI00244BBA40|nr:hypothetical protein [Nocardioides sp. CER19]MDH2415283.1 hypothetical protein [Nocardioides sp. CER19]